jgi:CheY-like chemotaxis protein/signal transduction histidine kinase
MSECSTVFEPDGDLDWVLTNYNAEISQTQTLEEELRRLQVLKSYLILDSEREPSFERLTGLAARMFRVPIALVSLVDLGRQWFMSNRGLGDVRETPRKFAFCAHAIISKEDLLLVPDATADVRFKDNPLVTGPPHIRFYAGAPLECPEGYKLGTLCLIDIKTRPDGLSLEEKQNLRELASLVVDAMVGRRREKMRVLRDKSQIIATTAHDLLTPLSGVQMSLSLLMEDEELKSRMTNSQKELIETAVSCGEVIHRMCHQAIETFRGDVNQHNRNSAIVSKGMSATAGPNTIDVADFVKNLKMIVEPFPKKVPLFISVDPLVPPKFVSDDLKIFRSALNFVVNALKKTESGSVHLKIYVGGKKKKPKLIFECEDTGPGVPVEHYEFLFRPFREPSEDDDCVRLGLDGSLEAGVCRATMSNSGLGLYSVANQISSLGGEYGFRPREVSCPQDVDPSKTHGAIFWFAIPLVVPKDSGPSGFSRDHESTIMGSTVTETATANGKSYGRKTVRVLATHELHPDDSAEILTTVTRILEEEHKVHPSFDRLDSGGNRVRRALVIDDSIVIRKSLNKALAKLGFDVTTAINGLEGLKKLQQQVFDIVLCDYLMPVMDGLDCVQQYRDWEEAHRPWFRQLIIGISAHASSSDIEKGRQAGMDDFKVKPVTMKELKELESSEQLSEVSKRLDKILGGGDEAVETMETEELKVDLQKGQVVHPQSPSHEGPLCLIAEPAHSTVMKEAVEHLGWHAVQVHDGEDALRLLKMRNWDSVFVENEISRLTGTRCIARFREWESDNRVARQNNVFLLSTDLVPSPSASVSALYPHGFDGALAKPILMKDLKHLLMLAEQSIGGTAASKNILAR